MAGSFQGRPFLCNVYTLPDVLKRYSRRFNTSHDPAMKKILLAIAITVTLLPATAQRQKRLSTHIEFIQQATISDKTIKNNTWGTGLGLNTQINPGRKLSPTIDLSAFYYFSGY